MYYKVLEADILNDQWKHFALKYISIVYDNQVVFLGELNDVLMFVLLQRLAVVSGTYNQ